MQRTPRAVPRMIKLLKKHSKDSVRLNLLWAFLNFSINHADIKVILKAAYPPCSIPILDILM